MKITIESTTRIVKVVAENSSAPIECRVWEGQTESGVTVQCLMVRITADKDADLAQFHSELQEQRPPSAGVQVWPLWMIL